MKFLLAIPIILIGFIVGLSLYLQPDDLERCGATPETISNCSEADAIVVVSGGDTVARTNKGIDLYKAGWAPYLVFSGAAYDKTGISNAAAMKLQAESAGVPPSAIVIDEDAVNTQQNAENTQSIIEGQGFENVILVTSGYHQRRASLEFNKQAENVVIRSAPVKEDKDWSRYWWATPRGWWLAGGETVKIIAFYFGVRG